VFENSALRRIYGPRRDEVTGRWRKLHNEELHDMYTSPSIIRNNQVEESEMGGAYSILQEKRNAYRLLVGKPEGKRPLGRPRQRWENNIKMDLGEIGWGGVVWTGFVWLRIGASVELL
jgi:hypothetical protein